MAQVYATKINGSSIAASAIAPGSALAGQISTMQNEIAALESIGAFKVVPLTSGADPVPDEPDPSPKIIYLTKDEEAQVTDPYTEWIYQYEGESSGNGHWEIIGTTSMDLDKYKKVQTPVSVTGGTLKGVASFSQNANGDVTLTLNDIQDGTTSQKGVVQLQGTIGASEAEDTKAATPKAVRDAITGAVAALDANVTSAAGTKVQVNVVEADGIVTGVTVTETGLDTALGTKADKVSGATNGNFAGLDSNGNLTDSGKKAADFATASHTHGNITNDGKIGSTANLAVVTGTAGAVTTADMTTADPTVPSTGTTTATAFIDSVSQDSKGKITATKKNLPEASTSTKGIVQLATSINETVGTENNKAATEKAVRDAINDLDVTVSGASPYQTLASLTEVDGKIDATFQPIAVSSEQIDDKADYYDGTGVGKVKVITGEGVKAAIDTLAVSDLVQDSSGSMAGKTLLTLSETSGKIAATFQNIQIAESQVTNLATDLAAKADKVTSATDGHFAGLDSNGNLTDSGKAATDFATAAQGALAASAVQDVTMAGASVVSSNVAAIPAATTPTPSGSDETTGAYGVVQITLMEI